MRPLYTLLAVSSAALLTACAGVGATTHAGDHAAHHAAASADGTPKGMHGGMHGGMQGGMHGRMQQMPEMQAFYEQMKNAKTPEERQALMSAHMKAMHEGMDPAKCMERMQGMQPRQGG